MAVLPRTCDPNGSAIGRRAGFSADDEPTDAEEAFEAAGGAGSVDGLEAIDPTDAWEAVFRNGLAVLPDAEVSAIEVPSPAVPAPLRCAVREGNPTQRNHHYQRTNARQDDFHSITPTNSGMHTERMRKSSPQTDKRAGSYQKTTAEGRAVAVKKGWQGDAVGRQAGTGIAGRESS